MSDVVDVVADVVEGVAEQTIDLAEMGRNLSRAKAQYASLGAALGVAAGAIGGYLIARRQLETKYNEITENEIAAMRDHYRNKALAAENEELKPALEDIIAEHGYGDEAEGPPMVVTPPEAVVKAADAAREAEEEEAVAMREDLARKTTRNVFRDSEVKDVWDYQHERSNRSADKPYIIHRDELGEAESHTSSSLTYYVGDDVLCGEMDNVIEDRDRLVGEGNLDRFGHGSGDANILYIRNDDIEAEMEIVRSPNSYSQEVHGLEPMDEPRRGRQRFDDEDEDRPRRA